MACTAEFPNQPDPESALTSDLTRCRVSCLPANLFKRRERTVLFLCMETGRGYLLKADELYRDRTRVVFAVLNRGGTLVLRDGTNMLLVAEIWRISCCG